MTLPACLFNGRKRRSAFSDMGYRIGVLDSGVGGLTVLAPMLGSMPMAEFIYYADNAWCPYGPREVEEVRSRVFSIVQGFVDSGCAMVVVACNTATAAAIEALRGAFSIPFVGMEPAVKPAALQSVTHVIGVLATHGTIKGDRFQRQLEQYGQAVEIVQVEGEGLVEIVEQRLCDTPMAEERVRKLVAPMVEKGIDQLVLGCTHYPFLRGVFERVLPKGVTVVNPAVAVSRQAVRVYQSLRGVSLARSLKNGKLLLVSSGGDASLRRRLEEYLRVAGNELAVVGELSDVAPLALADGVRGCETREK